MNAIDLAERGLVPDLLIRAGVRARLESHLRALDRPTTMERRLARTQLAAELAGGAIATDTEASRAQHYEVPSAFFRLMLGPRMKYSACHYPSGVETLAAAEEAMLELTCRRAGLDDGMAILDLGCGWGALSLWIAEHYPTARVTAVSHSHDQRTTIEAECRRRGIRSVEVVTCDVNGFEPGCTFDRIVSIEMLEHVRNHAALFERLASWLRSGGALFAHVFAHREHAYLYETGAGDDWMARHFFTGGMMPSDDWLPRVQTSLELAGHWRMPGSDYARTLEAWLAQLDAAGPAARTALGLSHDGTTAAGRLQRWRIFLIACAELFAYRGGSEWGVSHYLFGKDSVRR